MRRPNLGAGKTEHTVYVLNSASKTPEPVHVKTGITDGISTEITEGLKEGDSVVTSVVTPNSAPVQQTANPFGGGGPRRF
jgi:HlyD family secretion protein